MGIPKVPLWQYDHSKYDLSSGRCFILEGNHTFEPEVVIFWLHLIGCRSRWLPETKQSENAFITTCSGRAAFPRYTKNIPGVVPK